MTSVGLIAGKGKLPVVWAKAARQKGYQVFAFPLLEQADNPLEGIADQIIKVNIGSLDRIIKTLKAQRINKLVMIGKVEKSLLFQGLELDQRMKKMLASLSQLNDDDILRAIVQEFQSEGIEVLKQSIFIEDLFPQAGVLTPLQPDQELLADMKYGFKLAREIGRLDIGQTIVVKNRAVLAVEAIEGTDQTILRGGELAGPGIVAAKVSKPQQDLRFDIPTIGETTINKLIQVKARGLVIEAGKTFLLEQERVIKLAVENGIVIMAMDLSE